MKASQMFGGYTWSRAGFQLSIFLLTHRRKHKAQTRHLIDFDGAGFVALRPKCTEPAVKEDQTTL